ncbi:MAG: T9SS type A sorting domain-containing protein [Flavobacteriales bacterium]
MKYLSGQNQGSVSGAGDFAFELDCCPDYQIVRQWTAVDCSGNSSTCIQTISFEASDATNNGGNIVEEYTPSKTDELAIGQVSMNPNPAKDNVNFKFKATLNTRVSIDIYDITGKLIGNVFSSEVQRGNEYFTTFDVNYLPNGVYFVKTNNGLKITTEKLVVSK